MNSTGDNSRRQYLLVAGGSGRVCDAVSGDHIAPHHVRTVTTSCWPNRARRASAIAGAPPSPMRLTPTWRAGDNIRWQGRPAVYRRDVGDGQHAEIVIGERIYRVRSKEFG